MFAPVQPTSVQVYILRLGSEAMSYVPSDYKDWPLPRPPIGKIPDWLRWEHMHIRELNKTHRRCEKQAYVKALRQHIDNVNGGLTYKWVTGEV